MKPLADHAYPRLDPEQRVDIYVGRIDPPFEEVAIIDSQAYAFVDDAVKEKQIEELRVRARQLGANVLHEVRILPKQVSGLTMDEQVPFTSWRQGMYELYFMRATALRVPETEPATLAEIRPRDGWVVERMTPPVRFEVAPAPVPMPALRTPESAPAVNIPAETP